jgi:oligopeptide transport system substrate-binding protein
MPLGRRVIGYAARVSLGMKRVGLLVAAVASCALTACGGGASASRAPIGGASGKELADIQVIHLGNGTEIQTLDPHRGEEVQGANVMRDLFEGLVGEAANGDLVPGAAESWTMTSDGKTFTFALRRNARWSNGDAVTANDFVYGLRRASNPKTLSVYSFILSPIVNADEIAAGRMPPESLGVRAVDDYTLEIQLANPTPYFLGLLAHAMTYPLHRASVEQYGDQFTRPGNLVGNGAFKLSEWVVQSHIKLVRNPYYWDNANTKLDEVWYYPTEDQNAELQRFRANELDITFIIPRAQIAWIRENLADQLVIAPYLGSYYYGFNLTRPPFKDQPKLRRALALAVNREIITTQVLGSGEKTAFGWVPPVAHYVGRLMPEAQWTQAEREAEAKRLYAEAGYSESKPLRTEIMYNTQDDHRRVAVAIASMWKQVLGVEATITNQEWKVFIDSRNKKKDTQVFRGGWIGDYNDAFTFAEIFRSTAGMNDSGYDNPDYDRLVTQSQTELDADKRAALLEEAERILLADMPILPLYFYVNPRVVKPWVGGYESNIMDHHLAKYLYILKH